MILLFFIACGGWYPNDISALETCATVCSPRGVETFSAGKTAVCTCVKTP